MVHHAVVRVFLTAYFWILDTYARGRRQYLNACKEMGPFRVQLLGAVRRGEEPASNIVTGPRADPHAFLNQCICHTRFDVPLPMSSYEVAALHRVRAGGSLKQSDRLLLEHWEASIFRIENILKILEGIQVLLRGTSVSFRTQSYNVEYAERVDELITMARYIRECGLPVPYRLASRVTQFLMNAKKDFMRRSEKILR